MASDIGRFNADLTAQGRPYLLVGPGRWGSFDRFLGIPVKWNDISGVGAMVELRTKTLKADPSEGSHFFHRITSLGIPYVTVTEGTSDFFDWQWIDRFAPVNQTGFMRHIRFDKPFVIKTDGRTSRCVMLKSQ